MASHKRRSVRKVVVGWRGMKNHLQCERAGRVAVIRAIDRDGERLTRFHIEHHPRRFPAAIVAPYELEIRHAGAAIHGDEPLAVRGAGYQHLRGAPERRRPLPPKRAAPAIPPVQRLTWLMSRETVVAFSRIR